jgi:DNA ligase (NAD+)
VEILRSGDVIPVIARVLDDSGTEVLQPETCVECDSKLVIHIDSSSKVETLWCRNAYCVGQLQDYLTHVASRDILEIDGLGPDLAYTLVKEGYVSDLADLLAFQVESSKAIQTLGQEAFEKKMLKVSGFPSGAAVYKFANSLEKVKTTATWDRWIAALGINMIGTSLGKLLAESLELKEDDMAELPKKLLSAALKNIEGLGDKKSESLIEWAKRDSSVSMCKFLAEAGVRPQPLVKKVSAAGSLTGVAFCITGEFDETREEITAKLEALGAVSKSGVSSKCNLLVVGSAPGSSKTAKATQLGIKQVGKEWLDEVLYKGEE